MGLSDVLRRLGITKNAPTTRMDQMSAALHTSVVSILKDAPPEDVSELLDETLDQYREAVLDASMDRSAFAKASAPPFANTDDEDEDEDEEEDAADMGTCCGQKVKKGTVCKKCGSKVAKFDSEEEDMDVQMKKQFEARIAELQEQLASAPVAKAQFDALQEEVVTLRKSEAQRVNIAKAQDLLGEYATPEEVEQTAAMIEKGIDTTLVAKLAKQRAAFAKAASLTVEVGSASAVDATSPNAQIAKAAADLMAADAKLTKEQAITKAISNNPALYAATI